MYLNLPIRCPSSGTKNTTLETHTCKSPLSYLGCKNCRRRLFRAFSVFSGVFSLLRRESGSAPTNQDTVCWDRCFWLACLLNISSSATMNVRKISYFFITFILIGRKSFLPIKMKVIKIYEIFRHWCHHWGQSHAKRASFPSHWRSKSGTKRVKPGDDLEMRTALFMAARSYGGPFWSKLI